MQPVNEQTRPTREALHLRTAQLWSMRSLCRRENRKCGAVIVSGDLRRILSFGYNGPATGLPNESCTKAEGQCGCLHAEDNAIASLRYPEDDMVIYCTMMPCFMCAQRILQARINAVRYIEVYRDTKGLDILRSCRVLCDQVPPSL